MCGTSNKAFCVMQYTELDVANKVSYRMEVVPAFIGSKGTVSNSLCKRNQKMKHANRYYRYSEEMDRIAQPLLSLETNNPRELFCVNQRGCY